MRPRLTPRLACLALLLALVASCSAAAPLDALQATDDEVIFAYTGERVADAVRRASLYCANLGRNAELREVRQEENGRHVARFECR